MNPQGITPLSFIIQHNTKIIEEYLADNDLPTPSLDTNALPFPIPDSAPNDIKRAQAALVEACGQLKDVMTGPRELIHFNWTSWVSVKAILRFNIDKSFEVGEQTTFTAISEHTGLNLRNVTRIVRHAIINHNFFAEPTPGVIIHSGLTAIINRDDLVRNAFQFSLDDFWMATVYTVDAMEKWPNSEEGNETGFSLTNSTDKSMYEIFAQFPERGQKFGRLMSNVDEKREFLLDDYPWAEKRTMINVGGSHGSIALSIAERFPHINCVVQDLPEVIEEGKARLPAHLKERVKLMAYDFFTPQPIQADVYYFRSIFHNWSDKYSVKILRNLIPALKPGASIIIHERILPNVKQLKTLDAKRAINMDIGMLELLNSHQRNADDWSTLFKKADSRFRYVGAHKSDEAVRWIIEAKWQG